VTLRDDLLFDADIFLPPDRASATRTQAIINFITQWAAVGTSAGAGSELFFQAPMCRLSPADLRSRPCGTLRHYGD